MRFVKVHGLGNDFVILDLITYPVEREDWSELAIKICNRNFGVGGDGLVLITKSLCADIQMRIFNSDGTEPEMCGNAIRCVAAYAFEQQLVSSKEITVETKAGIIKPEVIELAGNIAQVRVNMGEPILNPSDIPVLVPKELSRVVDYPLELDGKKLEITCVSMGNPHCVIFVPRLDNDLVATLGPAIEKHPIFPKKTNVEFVQIVDRNTLKMRVWERGAGPTLACGTGACATLVAARLKGVVAETVTVQLAGGDLLIHWTEGNPVFMTGPAARVFSGSYEE